jgi:hypothetical protein
MVPRNHGGHNYASINQIQRKNLHFDRGFENGTRSEKICQSLEEYRAFCQNCETRQRRTLLGNLFEETVIKMKGSIEWTKISPKMKVVDTGTHWEADGKLVTFGSRDSKLAQAWLKKAARAEAQGTRKPLGPHWALMAKENAKEMCRPCILIHCGNRYKPFLGQCHFRETKRRS